MPSPEIARMLVDMNVPRTELVRLAHGMTPAKLAEVVRALIGARDRLRLFQDAGAQDAGQPGACHQRQGRSAAARRRRGDRRGPRLRRDRDDHARLAQRLVECGRLLRRRLGRAGGHAVPVLQRGGRGTEDRHGRLHLLCRDGVGLRHRASLHRRRRHALVEGVPRRRLCLARHQDALHLRRRLRAADGLPRKQVAALSRGALPLPAAGHGRAGHAERRHRWRAGHRAPCPAACAS